MSMKKFHKAAVALAVAGALAAPAANAVNISETGLGEFIYSPIYNVRDGFRTYINVHNTSEETVVFKIRFREHYASREVRDFNVTLSPYDVWTAQVFLNTANGAARLETPDHSCTSPIQIRDAELIGSYDVNNFTNWEFDGDNDDGGPNGLERTQMGYFEIINMGQDAETDAYFPEDNDTPIAYWAEHIDTADGRWPRNCEAIDGAQGWMYSDAQGDLQNPIDPADPTYYDLLPQQGWYTFFDEPENSLKVNVALVNTESGVGFDVPVTTLANFYNPDYQDQLSTYNIIRDPGRTEPDARWVYPPYSAVHTNWANWDLVSVWDQYNLVDPVSAVLMRANVINQFRSNDAQADTDWVVTFPTKHYYTDVPDAGWDALDDYLFPEFWDEIEDGEACVQVSYNFWDREEDTVVPDPDDLLPSPLPPTVEEEFHLCREVNIIRYGNGVLHTAGSATEDRVELDPPFTAGWVRLTFGPEDTDLDPWTSYDLYDWYGTNYEGLPVIGFAAQEADNYWSYSWEHAYGQSIVWWDTGIGAYAEQVGTNPAMGNDLNTPSFSYGP